MATLNWDDTAKANNLMWRAPRNIRFNDNIVVREDEYAVFLRDGKALAYIDRPDRYALSSLDAPVIGPIMKLFGVQQKRRSTTSPAAPSTGNSDPSSRTSSATRTSAW